jgi:hypothetical protein
MAKNVKEQARNIKTMAVERSIIPPQYQHLAAIGFIYVCLFVFFHSTVFEGEIYQ